jgi:DNA polymerase-3 subunit alpha
VKQTKGIEIDIEKIDFTDKTVLATFCRGESKGIFQFESGGMQDLLMKMQPDRLEDLIAANALYRPGPMELIPLYCNRKHGKEAVPSVHPMMDTILAETYGIMCIHEDTRIAMADGTEKPIRDVRRGDIVQSLNRETLHFESKECHGCGPTRTGEGVKITLENGYSVTLTPDHEVYTFNGRKQAGQLDPATDLVVVGRHLPQKSPTARHLAPWLGSDEDVAYLLGTLIGDGSMTAKGISLATGREEDHRRILAWIHERLPSLRAREYFHGRCWYLSLSHPQLLNDAKHGNRKTRLHYLLDRLGMKVTCEQKRVPAVIFQCNRAVRAAFLAGLLDADGCTATNKKNVAVCFLSSVSHELLQDVRRLCQLEGIPATIRPNRIQFWNLRALSQLLEPYLLARRFTGKLTEGLSVGWIPRPKLHEAVPAHESFTAFSARTGIMRAGMKHSYPFVKSSTAIKAGIDLGQVLYFQIAKIERVENQQFYGMSVEDHHNLVANGIVIKNCYQEQVMQVFNQLGGIELSAAYKLIKAISKKTTDVIAKYRPDFIKGAMEKGITKNQAEEIFELILKFGGYGFNKSHSTRYAIVAFQTAYMKTYHPIEYMAAVLTFEMGSTEKVVEYIEECRRITLPDGTRGIKVLPPDVNVSDKDFTPVYVEEEVRSQKSGVRGKKSAKTQGVIRFGMCAVRGVGEKAVEAIIEERNKRGAFSNLYEFAERVDLRQVQRSTIDALIKCGAFASISPTRAPLLNILDRAVEMGQQTQNDKRSGQMSIFGDMASQAASPASAMAGALPDIEELPNAELLKLEKELLGFYITSHPLTEHQAALGHYSTASTREAALRSEGTEVTIGGMISRVKKVITKNGRSAGMPMAIITLEDLEGQIDGTMFAETYADVIAKFPDAVKNESIIFVRGKVDKKRETPSLLINEVLPIENAVSKLTTDVAIKLDQHRHKPEIAAEIGDILKSHAGRTPVWIQIPVNIGQKATVRLNNDFGVRPEPSLVEDLDRLLGSGSAQMLGQGSRRQKKLEQQKLFEEVQDATQDNRTADEAAAEMHDMEMADSE